MRIIADTHTHTIISGDAFSTLLENIQMAAQRGMKYLCTTEHVYSVLYNAPQPSYFRSLHALPRSWEGVEIVRGVETNVIDYDGKVDMPQDLLNWLEWVIASMHVSSLKPLSVQSHTAAWVGVAKNPAIDVIGHIDDCRFDFDVDTVVKAFADNGKIVEINEQSEVVRPGSGKLLEDVLEACIKYDVPVVVCSDGHFVDKIAVFDRSIATLERMGFPEDHVLNADEARFAELLKGKRGF